MGISGWQARKKSYNRTTWRKSDRTWPNQVISQLRAKTVPTSALVIARICIFRVSFMTTKWDISCLLTQVTDCVWFHVIALSKNRNVENRLLQFLETGGGVLEQLPGIFVIFLPHGSSASSPSRWITLGPFSVRVCAGGTCAKPCGQFGWLKVGKVYKASLTVAWNHAPRGWPSRWWASGSWGCVWCCPWWDPWSPWPRTQKKKHPYSFKWTVGMISAFTFWSFLFNSWISLFWYYLLFFSKVYSYILSNCFFFNLFFSFNICFVFGIFFWIFCQVFTKIICLDYCLRHLFNSWIFCRIFGICFNHNFTFFI